MLDLKSFTIDEKIKLLAGRKDNWHTEDLDGKIPTVVLTDGPVGIRDTINKTTAIGYPSCEVLSQTWSPELSYEMGQCLADDCIEKGIDLLLAPGINIKRDPRCGRNFEYFSEDPYISGIFGREYIKGLQDKHVGATLKHFCCNNLEYGRFWVSSEVDERTLREIYTRGFEIALEAKPWAVMSSYNAVNGVKVSQHKKLNDMLREELGFDGLLMSDWGAVEDHTASVKSGVNLQMPYREKDYIQIKKDFEDGKITEEEIDASVVRVLKLIEQSEEGKTQRKLERTREERLASAQRIAEEGIVLLKNNGVLPLKNSGTVSIAGGAARDYMCGDGAAYVPLAQTPTPLKDCLEQELPNVVFSHDRRYTYWSGLRDCVPDEAIGKDVALVCVGVQDREEDDRPCRNTNASGIRLPEVTEDLIIQTSRLNKNTVVVLYCGAAVDMTRWVDKVAAVVWAGYCGERGQHAVAKVLAGKVNPSGKLTETFPLDETTTSAAQCYRDSVVNMYTDGLLVGYRWHDMQAFLDKPTGVRFPFGHGLSYSKFAYSNLQLEKAGDTVKVRFVVSNVDGEDGKEVAQVYVHERRSKVFRPRKELKGFKKVFVQKGGKTVVEIDLNRRDFAYYSTAYDAWRVEAGEFEILVGASAEDIRLQGVVTLD